jgi:ATP synthase protein I
MKEPDKLPSFKELDEGIRKFKGKISKRSEPASQGAGLALQVGVELVSGVAVGTGIGIVLDKWLGTSPLLLILCFFMGAAGGFLTLYRTINRVDETNEPIDESDKTL